MRGFYNPFIPFFSNDQNKKPMFNTRQNFHHSKLPKLGEIVELPSGNRGIVVSFPLCDNVLPYSIGIHTCHVRRLDSGKTIRIAGTWVTDAN